MENIGNKIANQLNYIIKLIFETKGIGNIASNKHKNLIIIHHSMN
jgi:hypothetical protein